MTSLANWIDARHLSPSAVEVYAREFHASPLRLLVLDDFLVLGKLDFLRRLMTGDGDLEQVNVAYAGRKALDRDSFDALDETERFYSELVYRGPAPGREMAPSVLTDLMFRRTLKSREFLDYLGAIVSDTLDLGSLVELRKMSGTDILNWHDDRAVGRAACLIIYLHEAWRPQYGGRFLCRRRGAEDPQIIEPLPNRAILFDPKADTEHAVEPLLGTGDGWARINYTVWCSGSAGG